MDIDLSISIRLSLQRALWCNLSPNVIGICCDWDDDFEWFILRYYLNIESNVEERELMSVTLTEFECDLQDFKKFYEDLIYLNENNSHVDTLRTVILWRKYPYRNISFQNLNEHDLLVNKYSMLVRVRLSLQRALIGNLSYHVRGICCDWDDGFEWFRLRYYLNIEPNVEEIGLISNVLKEFVSEVSDFGTIHKECIYSSEKLSKMDLLKHVIIWQDDELYFNR